MALASSKSRQLKTVQSNSGELHRYAEFVRRLARNKAAVVGAVTIVLLISLALAAPWITPYPPNDQSFTAYLVAPSSSHLFGTDQLGRDTFSRVVFGSRISLRIGLIAVSIAVVFGLTFGMIAGYYGGKIDSVLMRCMDVMLAFPDILLALAIVAVLGPALTTVMIAVGIASIPHFTRVVRATVLSAKESEYIDAARVVGCSTPRIIVRHLLPNTFAPVLVMATTGTAAAIITGAALSFLGLGVQPPTAEWGSMLSNGRDFIRHAYWMTLFPGIAIFVTVMAINLFGDGLRDALDPRLK